MFFENSQEKSESMTSFVLKACASDAPPSKSQPSQTSRPRLVRETFTLSRADARLKAEEWLEQFPPAVYWTRIDSWQNLPDGRITFTMVRLPAAK